MNSVLVPLTQGKAAVVDEADAEWLNRWVWHYHHTGYAARSENWQDERGRWRCRQVRMHRIIVGAEAGAVVDHVNGDTLDNRRVNLRIASVFENTLNRKRRRSGTSGFKGVGRIGGVWRARIQINGQLKHLGCFQAEEEAARAYDAAAAVAFGEHARLNFPGGGE